MTRPKGPYGQDRMDYKILVTDVHAVGQIGVVRSLGRAGYQVYAMSPKDDALGFHSNFANRKIVCVPYDDKGFTEWIQTYVKDNGIDLIVPSEGFLWAVQPIFDQLSPILPIKSDPDFIYRFINKYDYFREITESDNTFVRENCPEIIYVNQNNIPTAEDMARMQFPCFIKLDGVYGKNKDDEDGVIKVGNIEEALRQIRLLSKRYSVFLMQEYIPGQKAGVNLLVKDGEVKAQYVMKATHETPYTGGVASLRHTWRHDKMLEDAITKIRHLGWDGALMVEYRWNQESNEFALVEINLRFWGYLHLCLYAGIDFPRLLADNHLGIVSDEEVQIPQQVEVRNLTFETGYLLSLIKDSNVGIFRKAGALANFVWVGLSFNIFSDSFFPGDRGLWFHELREVVKNLFRRT